jgi:hypothetical protein
MAKHGRAPTNAGPLHRSQLPVSPGLLVPEAERRHGTGRAAPTGGVPTVTVRRARRSIGAATYNSPDLRRVKKKMLPPWLRFVEIHDLRVGSSSVDVALTRGRESASVELIERWGDVEVIVRR